MSYEILEIPTKKVAVIFIVSVIYFVVNQVFSLCFEQFMLGSQVWIKAFSRIHFQ